MHRKEKRKLGLASFFFSHTARHSKGKDKKCSATRGIKFGTGRGLIFETGLFFVHKIRYRAPYATILGLWEDGGSAKIKAEQNSVFLLLQAKRETRRKKPERRGVAHFYE